MAGTDALDAFNPHSVYHPQSVKLFWGDWRYGKSNSCVT